jgi:hypothetical protein
MLVPDLDMLALDPDLSRRNPAPPNPLDVHAKPNSGRA